MSSQAQTTSHNSHNSNDSQQSIGQVDLQGGKTKTINPASVGSTPLKKQLVIYLISHFCGLGIGASAPALLYIRNYLAMDTSNPDFWARFALVGGPSLMSAIFAIPFGFMLKKISRVKSLIFGISVMGLSGIACLVAPNIYSFVVARMLFGIGETAVLVSSMVLINLYFVDDMTKGKILGGQSGLIMFGSMAYTVLNTAFVLIDWRIVCALPMLALMCIPLVQKYLKEPKRVADDPDDMCEKQRRKESIAAKVAFNPIEDDYGLLSFCMLMGFVLMLTDSVVISVTPFVIESKSQYPNFAPMLIVVMSLANAATAMIYKRILRISSGNTNIIGFTICAIGSFFMYSEPVKYNEIWLVFAYAMFGVGMGILFPNIATYLLHLCSKNRASIMISMMTTAIFAGGFIAPYFVELCIMFMPLDRVCNYLDTIILCSTGIMSFILHKLYERECRLYMKTF